MSSNHSIGNMDQLADAFDAVGYTTDDVTKLKQFKNLTGIKAVLYGKAEIKPIGQDKTPCWIPIGDGKTMIAVNLGATPSLPFDGAEVVQHDGQGWVLVKKRKNGLYIDGRKVILHLSKRQQRGSYLKGHELREELTGKRILNANIIDALYENTHLIPGDWKKDKDGNIRFIYVRVTIYCDSDGNLYVRCLYFHAGTWFLRYCLWLDHDFNSFNPAALLAE